MNMRALWPLNPGALVLASAALAPVASAGDESAGSSQAERADFAALKAQLARQQAQIEQLRETLEEQKKLLDAAFASPSSGPAKPFNVGQVASASPILPLGALKPAAIPVAMPPAAAAAAPQKSDQPEATSPLHIQLGAVTITPVWLMELPNTCRSTNSGASLKTNFGNFPYNN